MEVLYLNLSGKDVFYFNFKNISKGYGAINPTKCDRKLPTGIT